MSVKRMLYFSLLAILQSVWSAQAQYEKGSGGFHGQRRRPIYGCGRYRFVS
jgi:hypothetical protein